MKILRKIRYYHRLFGVRGATVWLLMKLSGKMVQGWPSGAAVDSEDTMSFAAFAGVRPQIEHFPLEGANEAFAKVMENTNRFRAVLDIAS